MAFILIASHIVTDPREFASFLLLRALGASLGVQTPPRTGSRYSPSSPSKPERATRSKPERATRS
jgi:hypothetical protein